MQATLEIDDDVLQAVQTLAEREGCAPGVVVTALLRHALASAGVPTFPARGVVVTNELIDRLRDEGAL